MREATLMIHGGCGRQRDYSITLTINYLKLGYPGGTTAGIFNFKSANSGRLLLATSTQYVKRDVTSPRPVTSRRAN